VGGQLGSGTFINAGSATINVEHGTQLVFSDDILSGLTNNGVIAISGHSTAEVGPTDGHGSFQLQSGSTLQLDGAIARTQKIEFLSGNDTLVLNGASVFPTGSSLNASGDISGFRSGDVIQLLAPSDTPASVSYLQPYHVLAVRDAAGGLIAKLRLDGNYQSDAFALTADGKGNFDITLAGSTASTAKVLSESTFAVAPSGATAPDSITSGNGSIWVEYGNGASSTATPGTDGSSTIVQYSNLGAIENTYTISGSVDGLKSDPATGKVWALQNQDGNSKLTLINPATGQVSSELGYGTGYVYGANSSRGFDDVAFGHGKVFLSETNPANTGDPVVVQLLNGNAPSGILDTQSILRLGDTGTNLTTGATNQALPLSDPDSLKTLPDGSLLLTSGGDSSFIFIHHPGAANQSESFITLPSSLGSPDDAIMPTASSGTFYISAGTDNRVVAIKATDLNIHDLYASVGNALDQIDPQTGTVTKVAGGITGAHGLLFVPSGGGYSGTDPSSNHTPSALS
jgi:hypothetical protein